MKKGYLRYDLTNDFIVQTSYYSEKTRVLNKNQIKRLALSSFKRLKSQERLKFITDLTLKVDNNQILITWVVL